jgi:hypothetical protein
VIRDLSVVTSKYADYTSKALGAASFIPGVGECYICGPGGHQEHYEPESGKEGNRHRSRAERFLTEMAFESANPTRVIVQNFVGTDINRLTFRLVDQHNDPISDLAGEHFSAVVLFSYD